MLVVHVCRPKLFLVNETSALSNREYMSVWVKFADPRRDALLKSHTMRVKTFLDISGSRKTSYHLWQTCPSYPLLTVATGMVSLHVRL